MKTKSPSTMPEENQNELSILLLENDITKLLSHKTVLKESAAKNRRGKKACRGLSGS